MNRSSGIIVAAAMATAALWLVAPAAAAPVSSLTVLQNNTIAPAAETVQYRRRGGYAYRGRRFGGLGPGLGAGGLIGGANLGAPRTYYGRYGYEDYDPGYYSAPPDVGGDEIAYCQQRFRSYDPNSGSYLGFDGMHHPCP